MLTPLSWLKDYVDIDVTPKELEEKLFSCGFEVEESYEVGKDISNVVVGLVEKCEPIPETHLSLCQVNAGAHGTFQICCGADNVKAGGKYPLVLLRNNYNVSYYHTHSHVSKHFDITTFLLSMLSIFLNVKIHL